MMGPDFKTFRNLGHVIIAISIDAITSKKQYFKIVSIGIKYRIIGKTSLTDVGGFDTTTLVQTSS